MNYLLFHKGYETGHNLFEKLRADYTGLDFQRIRRARNLRNVKKNDTLIRWGSSDEPEIDNLFSNGHVLNNAKAIRRNTNKDLCFDVFRSVGLNTPKIFRSKHEINTFPVLGRSRHHRSGLDIVIINGSKFRNNDLSKIPTKDFYVEFLESKEEFRVHVFMGSVIRVTRKVFRGTNRDGEVVEKKINIKNDIYGWGHANVSLENFPDQWKNVCSVAVSAMGLSFGAVDLLVSPNGKPYVLEINSCPSLNPTGLDIYTNAIETHINKQNSKLRYFWAR